MLSMNDSRHYSPHKTTAHWSLNPKTRMREEDLQLDSA